MAGHAGEGDHAQVLFEVGGFGRGPGAADMAGEAAAGGLALNGGAGPAGAHDQAGERGGELGFVAEVGAFQLVGEVGSERVFGGGGGDHAASSSLKMG